MGALRCEKQMADTPRYTIRMAKGEADRAKLRYLHDLTFGDCAPVPDFQEGDWWLVTCPVDGGGREAAAFAGMVPSYSTETAGYLSRVGVHPSHRGHGLQRRLIRVREQRARQLGYAALVSDTTDNIPSANNLIAAGFRLFQPEHPWFTEHTLYWIKHLH